MPQETSDSGPRSPTSSSAGSAGQGRRPAVGAEGPAARGGSHRRDRARAGRRRLRAACGRRRPCARHPAGAVSSQLSDRRSDNSRQRAPGRASYPDHAARRPSLTAPAGWRAHGRRRPHAARNRLRPARARSRRCEPPRAAGPSAPTAGRRPWARRAGRGRRRRARPAVARLLRHRRGGRSSTASGLVVVVANDEDRG